MLRQFLNRKSAKSSQPQAPSENTEPVALADAQQEIEPDGPEISPPLQDIATGGRGAQRLSERVLLRRMEKPSTSRMSRNGILSLARHEIPSRIDRRIASLGGNSSRINMLGGAPHSLNTGARGSAGDDPTWLRPHLPSSLDQETTAGDLSGQRVLQPTRPPTRPRESSPISSVPARQAKGSQSRQPEPQASPRTETPPAEQTHESNLLGTSGPKASISPTQSPKASTFAGRSIARIADLSRITTAPIRRASETLRKSPALLHRIPLGNQKQIRRMTSAAAEPPQSNGAASKTNSDTGSRDFQPVRLKHVETGSSDARTSSEKSRNDGTANRPAQIQKLQPPTMPVSTMPVSTMPVSEEGPALPASRTLRLADSPSSAPISNRAGTDSPAITRKTTPAKGPIRGYTAPSSPETQGPTPPGAPKGVIQHNLRSAPDKPTSSSPPRAPMGVLQRNLRSAPDTATSSPPPVAPVGVFQRNLRSTPDTAAAPGVTPKMQTAAQPAIARSSVPGQTGETSSPAQISGAQPVESSRTASNQHGSAPTGKDSPSVPPAAQTPGQAKPMVKTAARSPLTPKTGTIARRILDRTFRPSLAKSASLRRAAQVLRKPHLLLQRESTQTNLGLQKISPMPTRAERSIGPSEVAAESAQPSLGAAKPKTATPLPLAGPAPSLSLNRNDVPLDAESSLESRPALRRQPDAGDTVSTAQSLATDRSRPSAVDPQPNLMVQHAASLGSSENAIPGVIRRTRSFVSRTKDLVFRKTAESGPSAPSGDSSQASQASQVSQPTASTAGPRLGAVAREVSPPRMVQGSPRRIPKDTAVLVYRNSEKGEPIARSASAPNLSRSEVGTVAARTSRQGQPQRPEAQTHGTIFDNAGQAVSDTPRQPAPAMLGERSLDWLSGSVSFPRTAVGSNETTFINGSKRPPTMISRSIADGMNHGNMTGQTRSTNGSAGLLNLLDLPTAGKRSEPLPLALSNHRNSPPATVTAGSLEAPDSAVHVISKQSPAKSTVSRQVAAAEPRPQIAAGIAVNGAGDGSAIQRVIAPAATEEKKQRPFDASEIEFIASKVYSYIKQKLVIEKERHGRPGASWWT